MSPLLAWRPLSLPGAPQGSEMSQGTFIGAEMTSAALQGKRPGLGS